MKEYKRYECIVFNKTKEKWGEFSNMCGGFPIIDDTGTTWRTSEHWYQAQYFTKHPHLMTELNGIASPMAAKMFRKKNRQYQDPEWLNKRVDVMIKAVAMKYEQHAEHFDNLFVETADLPIVELSHKDNFWGAKYVPENPSILRGDNTLGEIWMAIRKQTKTKN